VAAEKIDQARGNEERKNRSAHQKKDEWQERILVGSGENQSGERRPNHESEWKITAPARTGKSSRKKPVRENGNWPVRKDAQRKLIRGGPGRLNR
jgi:hypothetical protein